MAHCQDKLVELWQCAQVERVDGVFSMWGRITVVLQWFQKFFLCDCGVICFFLLCIKRAKSSCLPWLHYLVIVKSCRTLRYCHKALADLFVSRDIGDIVHLTNAIKMLLAVQTVFQPFTQYIHTCGFLLPFFFSPTPSQWTFAPKLTNKPALNHPPTPFRSHFTQVLDHWHGMAFTFPSDLPWIVHQSKALQRL